MLIKAGIVAGAAAMSLLAVSPLAFAGDYHSNSHHKSHHKSKHDDHDGNWRYNDRDNNRNHRGAKGECDSQTNNSNTGNAGGGLVNISHNNVAVPINACHNDVLSGVFGILSNGLKNNDND